MKQTVHVKCGQPGCGEYTFFRYENKKDSIENYKYRKDWKCTRHTKPNEVLTVENLTINLEKKFVALPSEDTVLKNTDHKFWWSNDKIGSGFVSGTGYKAWAKDFPKGTKLIVKVTAEIILPKND